MSADLTDVQDVEECDGGWLAARDISHVVTFVGDGGREYGGRDDGSCAVTTVDFGCRGGGPGQFSCPLVLALVPGLGLFVREAFNTGRVQVFVHHMDFMSPSRLAWMVGVVRGVLLKTHPSSAPCGVTVT